MLKQNNVNVNLASKFSSFNIVEKTLGDVVTLLVQNERLKRLLYYSDPHALSLPKLTPEQSLKILDSIKIVPKLETVDDVRSSIIITMDNFVPNENQTSFRSATLGFDIICDYDYWKLDDFKLRPYSIAGEIDIMVNKSNFNNFGIADFLGAKMLMISPESGGISLIYQIETFHDDIVKDPND